MITWFLLPVESRWSSSFPSGEEAEGLITHAQMVPKTTLPHIRAFHLAT